VFQIFVFVFLLQESGKKKETNVDSMGF